MVRPPHAKWRPSLSLIVFCILLTVFILPVLIVVVTFSSLNSDVLHVADIALAFGLSIVVVVGLGFVFVRALTHPVGELTDRTQRLMNGDRTATEPLTWHGSREIAALSHGLFSMAGSLFERADYISTFATHVSHELKTPLTSIRGATELLLEQDAEMDASDRRRFLENVLSDTERMTTLLQRLQDLARADSCHDKGESTVDEVIDRLQDQFSNLTLDVHGLDAAPVAMSTESLEIVFSNLFENAVQHGAKRLCLSITREEQFVHVLVADDGSGVSAANAERVFDLFFTTRRATGGTGMGLGIVQTLLRARGGDISLDFSDRSCGSRFAVLIPTSAR